MQVVVIIYKNALRSAALPLLWNDWVVFVAEQAGSDSLVLARFVRFVTGAGRLVALRGCFVGDLEFG